VVVIIAIAAAVLFLPNIQEWAAKRNALKEEAVVANEE